MNFLAEMTPEQERRFEKRATQEWSKLAGEPTRVERISGTTYAFGSELACLRLYKAFHGKARVRFSTNMGTWYFTPENESMVSRCGACPPECAECGGHLDHCTGTQAVEYPGDVFCDRDCLREHAVQHPIGAAR